LMSPFKVETMTTFSLHFTNKVITVFGDFLKLIALNMKSLKTNKNESFLSSLLKYFLQL
jgi:hypothetical protein